MEKKEKKKKKEKKNVNCIAELNTCCLSTSLLSSSLPLALFFTFWAHQVKMFVYYLQHDLLLLFSFILLLFFIKSTLATGIATGDKLYSQGHEWAHELDQLIQRHRPSCFTWHRVSRVTVDPSLAQGQIVKMSSTFLPSTCSLNVFQRSLVVNFLLSSSLIKKKKNKATRALNSPRSCRHSQSCLLTYCMWYDVQYFMHTCDHLIICTNK